MLYCFQLGTSEAENMKAAELWADWVKKQRIDDYTVKMVCGSLEGLRNKSSTSARLSGVLAEAEAVILRQNMEIASLRKKLEASHEAT